jgi:hypothetical protein
MERESNDQDEKTQINPEAIDKCPQKKTWPVIEMTEEERAQMTKPEVRLAGPYR